MGSAIFGAGIITASLIPVPFTLDILRSGPSKLVTFISLMFALFMLASEIPFLQVPETFDSVNPSNGLLG